MQQQKVESLACMLSCCDTPCRTCRLSSCWVPPSVTLSRTPHTKEVSSAGGTAAGHGSSPGWALAQCKKHAAHKP